MKCFHSGSCSDTSLIASEQSTNKDITQKGSGNRVKLWLNTVFSQFHTNRL